MTTQEKTPNAPTSQKLRDDQRYYNRELSWLSFNGRVLEEAEDSDTPLLERLRFLSIFQSNLDEFFMIRVSGLKQQLDSGLEVVSRDGLSPRQQLKRISEEVRYSLNRSARALEADVLPHLRQAGVTVLHYRDLSEATQRKWDDWYTQNVHPILTPLAVGPTQTFPFISSLSLNLALTVHAPDGESRLARVKVPPMLPRLLDIYGTSESLASGQTVAFLPIEELIAANVHSLFPGHRVAPPWFFRVTRDADLEIKEDEADDLLKVIQEELKNRRFGRAVRLEVQQGMPDSLKNALRRGLSLHINDVYEVVPPLDLTQLKPLLALDLPDHKFKPFVPRLPEALRTEDLFAALRQEDVLLHHPFDSFAPVLDFLQLAAKDPNVLAIKQTLYRTSGDSAVIEALTEAVANGKQVSAIVELKARFDEENNILWARQLEQAGVHVIYGVPGLKVHAKMCLVIRSEGQGLRRYAHVSTGNYNVVTSRQYTDFGLLTADTEITADLADLFNRLTGFSQPPSYRCILTAPHHLKSSLIERIGREAELSSGGAEASILLKCNAITDIDVIEALYKASQAGVHIDLLVRGICCLLPGKAGLSENITVRSLLGRFLEHSRLYVFSNHGHPQVFIGSSDLMDRNLKRRVEILVPIRGEDNRRRLLNEILPTYLQDTRRTRLMTQTGVYSRSIAPNGLDAQRQLLKTVD
jgi:polyphosphate kinase